MLLWLVLSGHRHDGNAWSMVVGSKHLILLTLRKQRLEPEASRDDLYEPASPARYASECFPNFPKQHRQLETKHAAHGPVAVISDLNCGTSIGDRNRLQKEIRQVESFVGLDTFTLILLNIALWNQTVYYEQFATSQACKAVDERVLFTFKVGGWCQEEIPVRWLR